MKNLQLKFWICSFLLCLGLMAYCAFKVTTVGQPYFIPTLIALVLSLAIGEIPIKREFERIDFATRKRLELSKRKEEIK